MRKSFLLAAILLSAACLFGCGSKTAESTIPTLDHTLYSREGDKIVFFEGEEPETVSGTIDSFNNVWFKIDNGNLYIAFDEGDYYKTKITGIDGMFIEERDVDNGIVADLYLFNGKRIKYKLSFYTEGYAPFTLEDMEKGFGKLTLVK